MTKHAKVRGLVLVESFDLVFKSALIDQRLLFCHFVRVQLFVKRSFQVQLSNLIALLDFVIFSLI